MILFLHAQAETIVFRLERVLLYHGIVGPHNSIHVNALNSPVSGSLLIFCIALTLFSVS